MRRREFIILLGGAAAAWPVVGRAQQPAMPVIGFLSSATAATFTPYISGFRLGLQDTGYIEGRNVAIEYRWVEGQYDRLLEQAVDLLEQAVDLARQQVAIIVSSGGAVAALAAKTATTTIPIVFVIGDDPLRYGLVTSLNRPGGNITGLSLFISSHQPQDREGARPRIAANAARPRRRGDRMRRRDFITLLGGAAATWPLAARAQQAAMRVIGFLNPTSPDPSTDRLRAFRQGLQETGHVEGDNVAIEYRWANNQFDRLPALATELVRRRVAVIATIGNVAATAATAATPTIPIVFLATEDPVKLGLVASLARPSGNATGINFYSGELTAKRLELLRELVPAVTRVAVLVNPANVTTTETTLRDMAAPARAMGLQIQVLNASTSREINAAFATFVHDRPDALFVGLDPFLNSRRVQLVNLASRHALPATFSNRDNAEIGGLMSYGANIGDAFRQVGVYAGRILHGAKPVDLPVVQATQFELVINAETARMLGLAVPPTLLATADEVIE
jgi:putative ABC transport system substrate-binding protein